MPSAQNQMPLAGSLPSASRLIVGMMLQPPVGQSHQFPKLFGIFVAAEGMISDPLAENIVGRRGLHALGVTAGLDGNVAEGRRRFHPHAQSLCRSVELRIMKEPGNEFNGILPVDGTGVVGENFLVVKRLVAALQSHHVAPIADIARQNRKAAAGGLQRTPAGKIPVRVAAEDRQNRGIASGRLLSRNRPDAAQEGFGGQCVNMRLLRHLQRRPAAQLLHGVVGHAVPDNQNIFHFAITPILKFASPCGIYEFGIKRDPLPIAF